MSRQAKLNNGYLPGSDTGVACEFGPMNDERKCSSDLSSSGVKSGLNVDNDSGLVTNTKNDSSPTYDRKVSITLQSNSSSPSHEIEKLSDISNINSPVSSIDKSPVKSPVKSDPKTPTKSESSNAPKSPIRDLRPSPIVENGSSIIAESGLYDIILDNEINLSTLTKRHSTYSVSKWSNILSESGSAGGNRSGLCDSDSSDSDTGNFLHVSHHNRSNKSLHLPENQNVRTLFDDNDPEKRNFPVQDLLAPAPNPCRKNSYAKCMENISENSILLPSNVSKHREPLSLNRDSNINCDKNNPEVIINIIDNPISAKENDADKNIKKDPAKKGLCKTTCLEKCQFFIILLLAGSLGGVCYYFYTLPEKKSESDNICFTQHCVKTASSLLAGMDQTADPCQDFFKYACGSWNKRHVIPEDRSSISTFEVMNDQLQLILRGLLEEPILEDEQESTRKAKLFYKSCINTNQIHEVGDEPMRRVIEYLGGWPVAQVRWRPPDFSFEALLGKLRGILNKGIFIDQWVGPDDKNSSVNIIQLDQMDLGLQSREMFLSPNNSSHHLSAYTKFMIDVSVILGASRPYAHTEFQEVLALETKLANASLPVTDRQDTGRTYMKLTLRELQHEVPQFNWIDYLMAFLPRNVTDDEPIVVYAMSYLKDLGKIIQETEIRTLWNYAIWRIIMDLTPHLTEEYQARRREFRTILLGIQADRNRWNLCIEWTNGRLGMAVGALFIKENFNHESKNTAVEMIQTLREAFSSLLEENDWMDDETRAVAREKANAMNEKIGYPEMLTDPIALAAEYKDLEIHEDEYLQNIFNVHRFEASKNLNRLRQKVNKGKWSTDPAVLNAFYNPNFNDIVFPAGILQPLFYSQHFPKSLNYGGIGVVIGHEMTHGFDDKGRQFDKDGNLKQWWNNRTIKAFRDRAQCIIDQYSGYEVKQVNKYMNGRMTQGENIADNGGIKQAYRAYTQWVSKNGEEKLLPGLNLTHDQLFFLNYAQIWCGTMRPEDALMKIRTSVHSIGPIRVLGPLSNSYDFARAYKCKVGTPMNPKKKCFVW